MIDFSCPACGAGGQHFSAFSALSRTARKQCGHCGAQLESKLGEGRYVLLLFYVHVVLALVGLPLVLGIAALRWEIAIAAAAIFAALTWPVAMLMHARSATLRA